jgi:hypothetical protein
MTILFPFCFNCSLCFLRPWMKWLLFFCWSFCWLAVGWAPFKFSQSRVLPLLKRISHQSWIYLRQEGKYKTWKQFPNHFCEKNEMLLDGVCNQKTFQTIRLGMYLQKSTYLNDVEFQNWNKISNFSEFWSWFIKYCKRKN